MVGVRPAVDDDVVGGEFMVGRADEAVVAICVVCGATPATREGVGVVDGQTELT